MSEGMELQLSRQTVAIELLARHVEKLIKAQLDNTAALTKLVCTAAAVQCVALTLTE